MKKGLIKNFGIAAVLSSSAIGLPENMQQKINISEDQAFDSELSTVTIQLNRDQIGKLSELLRDMNIQLKGWEEHEASMAPSKTCMGTGD